MPKKSEFSEFYLFSQVMKRTRSVLRVPELDDFLEEVLPVKDHTKSGSDVRTQMQCLDLV
jgi:hypothetical protein